MEMIYLDNSATTKQYPQVTEMMVRCMEEDFGNPSSLYQLGVNSEKILKEARKAITSQMPGFRAVFTSGGTESDNTAIKGVAKALRREGNRIVTTAVEHPAVLECCKSLEAEGYEVVRVGIDGKCRLDMDELEAAIDDKTILVSVMQVNNEVGTIMPVGKIKDIMKKKKAPGLFHCDAVQSFGKMHLPANADLIAISGHKIYGPKGSGALLIRDGKTPSGKRIDVPPFIEGGGQESGLRSGTENVAAFAGLGVAANLTEEAREGEMKRLGGLRELLRKTLTEELDGVCVNSVEEAGEEAGLCCPTILNVSFEGTRGEVLLHTLEQDGIYVSTGSACSSNKKGQSHVLKAMGLKDKEIEGTIRFSLGRYNTKEDIEFAAAKTIEAVKRFRKLGSFR